MDQKKEALAQVIVALLPDYTYAHAYTYAHDYIFARAHAYSHARAHARARVYAPFTEDQKAQIDAAYALIFG